MVEQSSRLLVGMAKPPKKRFAWLAWLLFWVAAVVLLFGLVRGSLPWVVSSVAFALAVVAFMGLTFVQNFKRRKAYFDEPLDAAPRAQLSQFVDERPWAQKSAQRLGIQKFDYITRGQALRLEKALIQEGVRRGEFSPTEQRATFLGMMGDP